MTASVDRSTDDIREMRGVKPTPSIRDHALHGVDVEHRPCAGAPRRISISSFTGPARPSSSSRYDIKYVRNAKEMTAPGRHIATRRVGPLDDQGLHDAERDRDDGGAGSVDDGVPETGGKIWTCEYLLVKAQGELVE